MRNFKRYLSNIPGWRTNRKIIVFESDDWGSVRMPSKNAFTNLKNTGIDLESNDYLRYNLNDTLASRKDLENLFELLDSYKDYKANSCVFTALSVVANPDFKKIKENNFVSYYYEPFTETLNRYYPGEKVFDLWKKGIEKKIFIPQFHGREHLNVINWLKALRTNHRATILAFNEGMWAFVPDKHNGFVENQAAFQLTSKKDIDIQRKILIEGLDLFEDIFGYRAEYFVPPNGPFNNSLNNTLFENGIKYRSTSKIQNESIDFNQTRKVINWLGKKDKSGIFYITRNCFFEPSQQGKDWIDNCLHNIDIAFRCKKPAIISTHRVNYIGVLNPKNAGNGLKQLKILLKIILKTWPKVEFMNTVQLGYLISQEN